MPLRGISTGNEYTISFDTLGGTPAVDSVTADYLSTVAKPATEPTKTGYTFDGWYLGETKIEATGTWTYEDTELVLVAKWTAKTTAITLEGIEDPVNVTYGASYTLPAATKTGYNFDGWYNGDTKVESTGTWANDVAALDAAFDNGAVVDAAALIEKGLVKKELDGIKVLAHGELTKKFTVKANAFSKEAKAKIEAVGGTAEVVE